MEQPDQKTPDPNAKQEPVSILKETVKKVHHAAAERAEAKEKPTIARMIKKGHAHIQSTYNNTIITLTDMNGNVLAWSSSGTIGFKGAKKSTPYAAGLVVEDAVNKVRKYGLEQVDVFVKGIGSGRESALRALQAQGLEVISLRDVTPVPHNGCRPRKIRRV